MSIFHALSRDPNTPVVPPLFELSAIERTHSWWLYLWPFQSRKALVTVLCIVTVGSLLETLIVLRWLDPGALPWALTGGLLGAIWLGPYRALPARMTIATRSEARYFLNDIKQLVELRQYVAVTPVNDPAHVHFRHKAHFTWAHRLAWDEQDADLRWKDQQIELRGPINLLESVHRQLLQQLEKEGG